MDEHYILTGYIISIYKDQPSITDLMIIDNFYHFFLSNIASICNGFSYFLLIIHEVWDYLSFMEEDSIRVLGRYDERGLPIFCNYLSFLIFGKSHLKAFTDVFIREHAWTYFDGIFDCLDLNICEGEMISNAHKFIIIFSQFVGGSFRMRVSDSDNKLIHDCLIEQITIDIFGIFIDFQSDLDSFGVFGDLYFGGSFKSRHNFYIFKQLVEEFSLLGHDIVLEYILLLLHWNESLQVLISYWLKHHSIQNVLKVIQQKSQTLKKYYFLSLL